MSLYLNDCWVRFLATPLEMPGIEEWGDQSEIEKSASKRVRAVLNAAEHNGVIPQEVKAGLFAHVLPETLSLNFDVQPFGRAEFRTQLANVIGHHQALVMSKDISFFRGAFRRLGDPPNAAGGLVIVMGSCLRNSDCSAGVFHTERVVHRIDCSAASIETTKGSATSADASSQEPHEGPGSNANDIVYFDLDELRYSGEEVLPSGDFQAHLPQSYIAIFDDNKENASAYTLSINRLRLTEKWCVVFCVPRIYSGPVTPRLGGVGGVFAIDCDPNDDLLNVLYLLTHRVCRSVSEVFNLGFLGRSHVAQFQAEAWAHEVKNATVPIIEDLTLVAKSLDVEQVPAGDRLSRARLAVIILNASAAATKAALAFRRSNGGEAAQLWHLPSTSAEDVIDAVFQFFLNYHAVTLARRDEFSITWDNQLTIIDTFRKLARALDGPSAEVADPVPEKLLTRPQVVWALQLLREVIKNIRLSVPVEPREIKVSHSIRKTPNEVVLTIMQEQFEGLRWENWGSRGIDLANELYGDNGAGLGKIVAFQPEQEDVGGTVRVKYRVEIHFRLAM